MFFGWVIGISNVVSSEGNENKAAETAAWITSETFAFPLFLNRMRMADRCQRSSFFPEPLLSREPVQKISSQLIKFADDL